MEAVAAEKSVTVEDINDSLMLQEFYINDLFIYMYLCSVWMEDYQVGDI